MEDVRLLHHLQVHLGQEGIGGLQLLPPVKVVLLRQAQKEGAPVGVGQATALPHGVHPLGHGVEDLLRAEGLGEGLLTGDAVEQGEDHRLLPHVGGGQGHGRLQIRGLHGEQQQLSRALQMVCDLKLAGFPVAPGLLLAEPVQPLPLRQKRHLIRAQALGEGVAVKNAQGAPAHNGHLFHSFVPFLP